MLTPAPTPPPDQTGADLGTLVNLGLAPEQPVPDPDPPPPVYVTP
jgi:hypothetical protein